MPTLEIDHLDKSYGSVRALRDMTFDVHGGEIFGFVGSNGAGKTTTMRITLGVLAADAGEVRWDGRPVDLDVRRRIGYMPEERGLYPKMKVGEQLVYLARLHGMSTSEARAATEHWTELLGVAARRDDEVQKLSLGNQQRVQLAAALVTHPEILVLDEPFSGLDPVAVDVMSGVLRERAEAGVPVIFSSHQLELVERLCDRVGIIRDGTTVAVGTIDDLRTTPTQRWLVDGPPSGGGGGVDEGGGTGGADGDGERAPGWALALPGVTVVSTDGPRTVLELAPDAADGAEQAVLRAALDAGPVREFTRVRPSLVDLYRDVVAATGADDEPGDEGDASDHAAGGTGAAA
ncbi:ABC transporter ATP-binding protein [Luteimicrobium subarcticum]|uniref:ABC transporter ATP-binding protein n=1 Tax=Luteimicrobium subarcticum TaxID=620910 RepID=UPI001B805D1F|nr:ATP-binding cassette domain-containing protein [Luteimicrobium subarcticum]